MSLDSLHPSIAQNPSLLSIRKGLEELLPLVDVPEGRGLTHDDVKRLHQKAATLSHVITDRMNG
jgi:hypothetical protein